MPQDGKLYAVITTDIVASRRIARFQQQRDRKLKTLSEKHGSAKLILSPYAVTAWDEFQTIVAKPKLFPTVILDLRRHFAPVELWIAVGLGEVSQPYRKPVNVFAGGEAFERARVAADELKSGRQAKYRVLTAIKSGNELFDRIANTTYHLHDALVQTVSAKQWSTINTQIETGRQELTAKKLHLDESTVSRTLRRGFYWQMQETCSSMEQVIEAFFGKASTRRT